MSEKIVENMKSVKMEQASMIQTIRAVRGDRYADCVELAIASASIVEMMALLRSMAGQSNSTVADALGNACCTQLATMMVIYHRQSPIDDDRVPDIMVDADRIIDTTRRLLSQALDAARHNKPFGDSK